MYEIIYGIQLLKMFLKYNPSFINLVFIYNLRKDNVFMDIINIINQHKIKIRKVNKNFLNKLSNNGVHQGIVAFIKPIKLLSEIKLYKYLNKIIDPVILILDHVLDPYNLGSCIRTASALYVNIIIIPYHRSVKLTPITKKVSCGGFLSVPIFIVKSLKKILIFFKKKKIKIFGSDSLSNQSLYNFNFHGPIALIIGSENKGIQYSLKNFCDVIIKIPTYQNKLNLNLSVSCGIFLYEISKYRSN